MITYDTETCGLTGPPILIQYRYDDGPIMLHNIWDEPMGETRELIEDMMEHEGGINGFNLTFDQFKLHQGYNVLRSIGGSKKPPTIAQYFEHERLAPFGPDACALRPAKAMDLMLHARTGPLQALMPRKAIVVRRVPVALAEKLAKYLDENVEIPDVFFARRPNNERWVVSEKHSTEFPDIVLSFAPKSSLKAIAQFEMGMEVIDFPIPKDLYPEEFKWCPFAWEGRGWTKVINAQIDYWRTNVIARKYAELDVEITYKLWEHWGRPEPGEIESELACAVASARYRGFAVDIQRVKDLKAKAEPIKTAAPRAPHAAKGWIQQVMDPLEAAALKDTTDEALEIIGRFEEDGEPTEAAVRARAVSAARSAEKELDVYDKLLAVGTFHPDFSIVGTRSDRMAGTGGFSAHGIPKLQFLRECFEMAYEGEITSGGDFDAFEVSIAAAVYDDTKLTADLKDDKSIHAILGSSIYEMPYEDIMATKNTSDDKYKRSKNGVFAMMYGAEARKLAVTWGVSEDDAAAALERFYATYPGVGEARRRIASKFQSMRQTGGIGTRIEWHEPVDFIESLLGFRRYFTLENKTCRALFDLANNLPREWHNLKGSVSRRKGRSQSKAGATMSAVFSAAFQLQAANMRAAANHEIQSTGAEITKQSQRDVWHLQPIGCHPYRVRTFNVHDELVVVHTPDMTERVEKTVKARVEKAREVVPLCSISWGSNLKSWGAV